MGWLMALVLLVACSSRAQPPDPLARYAPALRRESLPPDFDFEAYPRYDTTLTVDPAQRTVKGTTRIHFRNLSGRPLNDIYVRLYPNLPQLGGGMKLTRSVTIPDGYATGMGFAVDNTAARLSLTEPLPPNEAITVELDFEVQAPSKSGYVLFGESEGILSLPYSYPVLAARSTDPARPWRLDVPPQHGDITVAEPAFYAITATVPSDVMLISSGVEVSRTEATAGWTNHYLVAGPDREWAMAVGRQLQSESTEVEGTRLNSFFLPQDSAMGRQALAESAAVLRAFNRLFVPYPYTELDVMEAPTRYLGMEYPGLNYIGVDAYREQRDSQPFLIAHELAHQWWYALVGSDPFRYPWLDEGLAEHSALLATEMLYGTDAADRIRTLRWQVPVKWAVDNGYDEPVGQSADAFDGTNYEILTYAKSAMFFDALYHELGRDTYLNVLREFIARYRFKTPTPEDFLALVQEVGGIDPQPLYQQWILNSSGQPNTPTPSPTPAE